jgi:hypothetical protein
VQREATRGEEKCLQVSGRVPVRIEKNEPVRADEVQAHAARFAAQEEYDCKLLSAEL